MESVDRALGHSSFTRAIEKMGLAHRERIASSLAGIGTGRTGAFSPALEHITRANQENFKRLSEVMAGTPRLQTFATSILSETYTDRMASQFDAIRNAAIPNYSRIAAAAMQDLTFRHLRDPLPSWDTSHLFRAYASAFPSAGVIAATAVEETVSTVEPSALPTPHQPATGFFAGLTHEQRAFLAVALAATAEKFFEIAADALACDRVRLAGTAIALACHLWAIAEMLSVYNERRSRGLA